MGSHTADSTPDSLDSWLRSLIPDKRLGSKAAALFETLARHPNQAAFASSQDLALLSGTTVATVTRLAQNLGFTGWPDFQRQIRTRYLSHLSTTEVARVHSTAASPAHAALVQDADTLTTFAAEASDQQLTRIAQRLATARRIYISAEGSYAAIATAMAHNINLAGYDALAVTNGGAAMANAMAKTGPEDVHIVVSFWRLYELAVITCARAQALGAAVFVIADTVPPQLQATAHEIVPVPSEGMSFFPSLTAGMAAQQAIVTALAAVDPERTGASIAAADQAWKAYKLLHR